MSSGRLPVILIVLGLGILSFVVFVVVPPPEAIHPEAAPVLTVLSPNAMSSDGLSADEPKPETLTTATPLHEEARKAEELMERLHTLVLPHVEFSNLSLGECLQRLQEESVRADPEGIGVDIVIDPSLRDEVFDRRRGSYMIHAEDEAFDDALKNLFMGTFQAGCGIQDGKVFVYSLRSGLGMEELRVLPLADYFPDTQVREQWPRTMDEALKVILAHPDEDLLLREESGDTYRWASLNWQSPLQGYSASMDRRARKQLNGSPEQSVQRLGVNAGNYELLLACGQRQPLLLFDQLYQRALRERWKRPPPSLQAP